MELGEEERGEERTSDDESAQGRFGALWEQVNGASDLVNQQYSRIDWGDAEPFLPTLTPADLLTADAGPDLVELTAEVCSWARIGERALNEDFSPRTSIGHELYEHLRAASRAHWRQLDALGLRGAGAGGGRAAPPAPVYLQRTSSSSAAHAAQAAQATSAPAGAAQLDGLRHARTIAQAQPDNAFQARFEDVLSQNLRRCVGSGRG